jgi:hypothetical protein
MQCATLCTSTSLFQLLDTSTAAFKAFAQTKVAAVERKLQEDYDNWATGLQPADRHPGAAIGGRFGGTRFGAGAGAGGDDDLPPLWCAPRVLDEDLEERYLGMSSVHDHPNARSTNAAMDKAAGYQWADRALAAVEVLGIGVADDNATEPAELVLHHQAFALEFAKIAAGHKTQLSFGPHVLTCLQVAAEARLRTIILDAKILMETRGNDQCTGTPPMMCLADIQYAHKLQREEIR